MTDLHEDKNECLIHLLTQVILDTIKDNQGIIIEHNKRHFVIRKSNDKMSLMIQELPPSENTMQAIICPEHYIKIT